MEYEVVETEVSVDHLKRQVKAMIELGWEPLGGVAITLSESDNYRYFLATQAMIKED